MADDDAIEYDDDRVCKVYDKEDFFTVFVQLMLAAFALFSLWFKRQRESPKRTFRTWFLDVAKQGVGAIYAHVLNMVIASIIIENVRGEGDLNDQCAWYGICYLVDTTLGLVLAIWGLKILYTLAHRFNWVALKHSGVYAGEDAVLHWIWQVLAWVIIMTVSKIIIYYFMVWTSEPLAFVGGILFEPLQSNIRFELLFVMILFPGFLNVIYFWIADGFLKAKPEHAGAHIVDEKEAERAQKKEALLTEMPPIV